MIQSPEKLLKESNLIISHKALVSNSRCEDVYKNVYNHIRLNEKNIVVEIITLYELEIIKTLEPNYILVKYVKNQGWLYMSMPIKSLTEINFRQINSDVEVAVKMYKLYEHQTKAPFTLELLTVEKAKITWVDFVLEIFKAAHIDDYKGVEDRLLSLDVTNERNNIEASNRNSFIKSFKIIAFCFSLLLTLIYLLGLLYT